MNFNDLEGEPVCSSKRIAFLLQVCERERSHGTQFLYIIHIHEILGVSET